MKPEVERDFQFGRQFLPELKAIAGRWLIGEASEEDDCQHNTDLMVLRLDGLRVACRVRRETYLLRYGDEFTIRSSRASGAKTELAKIVEGWGSHMIYGFGSDRHSYLLGYAVLDLRVFRGWFQRELAQHDAGHKPGSEENNHDGTFFRAFRYAEMPDNLTIYTHGLPQRKAPPRISA